MFKKWQQPIQTRQRVHILDAGLFLTAETAECLSLRISDIIEFDPSREAFIQKIGSHNVGILAELEDLHLHDFGISLELSPDDEEKALLENNIQTALSAGLIDLDDAIDIREVKNLKLANQLLKLRRKKKARARPNDATTKYASTRLKPMLKHNKLQHKLKCRKIKPHYKLNLS